MEHGAQGEGVRKRLSTSAPSSILRSTPLPFSRSSAIRHSYRMRAGMHGNHMSCPSTFPRANFSFIVWFMPIGKFCYARRFTMRATLLGRFLRISGNGSAMRHSQRERVEVISHRDQSTRCFCVGAMTFRKFLLLSKDEDRRDSHRRDRNQNPLQLKHFCMREDVTKRNAHVRRRQGKRLK